MKKNKYWLLIGFIIALTPITAYSDKLGVGIYQLGEYIGWAPFIDFDNATIVEGIAYPKSLIGTESDTLSTVTGRGDTTDHHSTFTDGVSVSGSATTIDNATLTNSTISGYQTSLTNPITGTSTNHYWPYFTGGTTLGGKSITASKPVCSDASGDPGVCAGTEGVWAAANTETLATVTARGHTTTTGVHISGLASEIDNCTLTNSTITGYEPTLADASTTVKGKAMFAARDFNVTDGNVTIDFVNTTQSASGVTGVLTGADWDTFNGKQASITRPVSGPSSATDGHVALFDNSNQVLKDGGALFDPAAPGAIGGTTAAAGTFTKVDVTADVAATTGLSKDASNNLVLTDAVTGSKTLAQLIPGSATNLALNAMEIPGTINGSTLVGLAFSNDVAVGGDNNTFSSSKAIKTYADTKIGGTLGATANVIPKASGTGAKTLAASGITENGTSVDLGALNLVTTGTIQGKININSDADGEDNATMAAAGMYGTLFVATGAGTWILPTAVAGMSLCLMDSGTAHDLILDCQPADTIRLKGTEGSAGVGITNASGSTTGDFVCVVAVAAGKWSTMGIQGTWASQ